MDSAGVVKKRGNGHSLYHGKRVVGQRLLGGIWHCTTYAARHPERGISYARWEDGIVFARQYAQMHAAGVDATPATTLDPASRKHRRHLPAPGALVQLGSADEDSESDLVEA